MEVQWIVDNVLNFTPHIAVLALVIAAYAIFDRHWPVAIASLLIVAVGTGFIARSDALLVRAQECGVGTRVTIATFNVQNGRADLDAFARFIEAEDVDIVVLEEMSSLAIAGAGSLYEQFSYRASSRPRWVEILSKEPLEEVGSFHVPGQSKMRRIWRVTLTDPVATDLYFLHGMTPRSAIHREMRSNQFALVAELLGETSTPAIVVGDMNATILDPSFAAMLRATDLRSAVAGRADAPSWPVILGPFGVHIDHVLERGFEVCSVTYGSSFGSDHRPMVVELGVPAS